MSCQLYDTHLQSPGGQGSVVPTLQDVIAELKTFSYIFIDTQAIVGIRERINQ